MEKQYIIQEVKGWPTDGPIICDPGFLNARFNFLTEAELRGRVERIVGFINDDPDFQFAELSDWYWQEMMLPLLLHGEPKKDEWEEWLKTIPVPGAYETEEEHLRRVRAWLDKDPRGK